MLRTLSSFALVFALAPVSQAVCPTNGLADADGAVKLRYSTNGTDMTVGYGYTQCVDAVTIKQQYLVHANMSAPPARNLRVSPDTGYRSLADWEAAMDNLERYAATSYTSIECVCEVRDIPANLPVDGFPKATNTRRSGERPTIPAVPNQPDGGYGTTAFWNLGSPQSSAGFYMFTDPRNERSPVRRSRMASPHNMGTTDEYWIAARTLPSGFAPMPAGDMEIFQPTADVSCGAATLTVANMKTLGPFQTFIHQCRLAADVQDQVTSCKCQYYDGFYTSFLP